VSILGQVSRLAALSALMLWLAPVRAVQACSCAEQGFDEARQRASAIFEGQVKAIEAEGGRLQVRFWVVRSFKGASDELLTLGTATDAAACGYSFQVGQSYLVYAEPGEGGLEASRCTRTRPMAEAGDDLDALGMGATPVDPGRGHGAKPLIESEKDDKQPPAQGGCASCSALGANVGLPGTAWGLLPLGLITWRRLRRRSWRAAQTGPRK